MKRILLTSFSVLILNALLAMSPTVGSAHEEGTLAPQAQASGHTMSNEKDQNIMMQNHNKMMESLHAKSGDEFDKAFLSQMIMHHQGALDMAKIAKENAKHQEIKTMADNIIKSQTAEIDQMKQWQQSWGHTK